MWAYRHHFCTKDIDDGIVTFECGVEDKFDKFSHASHRDQNIIGGESKSHKKYTRDNANGLLIFTMC